MIGWLEWIIGYSQAAGLEFLIYGIFFQAVISLLVTVKCAPVRWSTQRVILAFVLWPLTLIVLMVAAPVKALRRRRQRPHLAVDRLARQHREDSNADIEHVESIVFWRTQLNAESAAERECAVRMLTEVYDVPLEESKTEAKSRFEIFHGFSEEEYVSQSTPPVDVAASTRKIEAGLITQVERMLELAIFPPSQFGDFRRCLLCGGTGMSRIDVLSTCSACAGVGQTGVDKPYADRHCVDCGEIFRFRQRGVGPPSCCSACTERHAQKQVDPVKVALAVRDQIIEELRGAVRVGTKPLDTAPLYHQLTIMANEHAKDLPGMTSNWISLSKYGPSSQYALGARVRTEVKRQRAIAKAEWDGLHPTDF